MAEDLFGSSDKEIVINLIDDSVQILNLHGEVLAKYPFQCLGKKMLSMDIDNDNDMDLLTVGCEEPCSLLLFENQGDKLIVKSIAELPFCGVSLFESQDVDRDGDLDLLMTYADSVYWMERKNQTLSSPRLLLEPMLHDDEELAGACIADLDMDGRPDLLVSTESKNGRKGQIYWYPKVHEPEGTSTEPVRIDKIEREFWRVDALDFDLDGNKDLIAHSLLQGDLRIMSDVIEGNYRDYMELSNLTDKELYISEYTNGDIDSDGDIDIVVASKENGAIGWMSNNSHPGSFDFSTENVKSINIGSETTYDSPQHLLLHDLSSDGKPDLVGRSFNTGKLADWVNHSNQTGVAFSDPIDLEYNDNKHHRVYATDLDQDGDNDIVSTHDRRPLLFFRNSSDGDIIDFDSALELNIPSPGKHYIADFDGDEKDDVLINLEGLTFYRNVSQSGHLQFDPPVQLHSSYQGSGLTPVDIDSDGDLDLIFDGAVQKEDYLDYYFKLYKTEWVDGVPFFEPFYLTLGPFRSTMDSYRFLDLDEDGDLDFLFSARENRFSDKAWWQEYTGPSYQFYSGRQGWEAYSGFEGMDSVEFWHYDSSLHLGLPDSAPGFGFWSSPPVEPQYSEDSTGILRSRWKVTSNTDDLLEVPTLRLRTSRSDFSRSDMTIINSSGNGLISPPKTGRTYTQQVDPAENTVEYIYNFEYLHSDPLDSEAVIVELNAMIADYVSDESVRSEELVYAVDFRNSSQSTHDWYENTILHDFMYAPESIYADDGLIIYGVSPDNTTRDAILPSRFGSWTHDTRIKLEGGALYRISWTVESDAAEADKARVPSYRFRVNESTYRFAQVLRIDSTGDCSDIPFHGKESTHVHWVSVPNEIDGSELILSFDYLYINRLAVPDDDPMISLALKEVQVHQIKESTD